MINIDTIYRLLDPRPFFIGVIISLFCLSFSGWQISEKNIFHDYKRIHRDISIDTQFFPTARQIGALVEEHFASDKIAVVIAGSSVMRGTGQSSTDLWSNYLQMELGDKYRVLNLALNGGGPSGQGLYMTEYLLRNHKKVLLISDIQIGGNGITPDNGSFYRYFYFDSYNRGYSDQFVERMNETQLRLQTSDYAGLHEFQIKSYLNRFLNFDDLWNTIGYRYFFTIWTPLRFENPWAPHRFDSYSEKNCIDNNVQYKINITAEMAIVRGYTKPGLTSLQSDSVNHSVLTSISEHIRSHTILVLDFQSPFYVDQLSEIERNNYWVNIKDTQDIFKILKIPTFAMPLNLTYDDFCDRVHLSYTGGRKLATMLAPYVHSKSSELGYE